MGEHDVQVEKSEMELNPEASLGAMELSPVDITIHARTPRLHTSSDCPNQRTLSSTALGGIYLEREDVMNQVTRR